MRVHAGLNVSTRKSRSLPLRQADDLTAVSRDRNGRNRPAAFNDRIYSGFVLTVLRVSVGTGPMISFNHS